MPLKEIIKTVTPGLLGGAFGSALGYGIAYIADALMTESESTSEILFTTEQPNAQSSQVDPLLSPEPTYDSEGYNKDGYNSEGFSRDGFDLEGFGKDLFNIKGFDRSNRNRRFYMGYLAKLYSLKEESLVLLDNGSYRYALLNSRTIVDDVLSLLLGHALGNTFKGAKLSTKLNMCEEHKLLGEDKEFINGLHGVCKICSPRMHTIENESEITHQQVYFTIMKSMELLHMAEKKLLMS